jgi:hypothetical protein
VPHWDRSVAAITLKHVSLSWCKFKKEECRVHNYRHAYPPPMTEVHIHKLGNKTYWIWQYTEEDTVSDERNLEYAVAYKLTTGEYLD